jgi:hypothetical protein
VNQFDEYCFFVECNKRSEDDLIKNLWADQVLYTDCWDSNYWQLLT